MTTDDLYIVLWALSVPFFCACIVAVAVVIKATQYEAQDRRARRSQRVPPRGVRHG